MAKNQPDLTIGSLADKAGVNVETVRYYQRKGLIKEPIKPAHGFRKYPCETIGNIQFIKRAQRLGFSLKEIGDLLELGSGHCSDVRSRAEIKRDKIHNQIQDLEILRDTLDQLIHKCKSGEDDQDCPIVQSLLNQDD